MQFASQITENIYSEEVYAKEDKVMEKNISSIGKCVIE